MVDGVSRRVRRVAVRRVSVSLIWASRADEVLRRERIFE